MGTSMGGCTALVYAELAPKDVKDLIAGVVSVEAAGDLTQLYHESMHNGISNAMLYAFGGTPEQVPERYDRRSFIKNLSELPKRVRVVEISAKDDEIVPPHFQHDIVDALRSKNYAVELVEVDSGHGAPPSEFYVRGFDNVTTGG
jgi:homoserine acetyltransferase